MRQVLLLLLLLNAVFFLWETYARPSFDAVPLEMDSSAKLDRIVLVKELPPVPEVKVSGNLATPQLGKRADEPPKPASSSSTALPLPPLAQAAPKAAEPAPEPPAAQNPPKPAAVPAPKTLAESARPPAAVPAKPPAPEESAKSGLVPSQCRRMGPLNSEADVQALRQRLAGGAEKVSIEHKSGKSTLGYWVLYPPAANVEQARANKRMLVEKGAKEAALLNDGEYARGVSLGFFKERAGAEKALSAARAKGMNVVLKARVEQREEFWLKLQTKSAAATDAQWQAWREQHPGSAGRDNACP